MFCTVVHMEQTGEGVSSRSRKYPNVAFELGFVFWLGLVALSEESEIQQQQDSSGVVLQTKEEYTAPPDLWKASGYSDCM